MKNRSQLLKATDTEIIQFFKTVIFRGSFSISIPSEHQSLFCGQITDITINGEQNNLCPKQLFVPVKFKQFIKDGTCEFIATANLKALRDESHSYKLLIKNIKNIVIPDIDHFDKNEEALFRRNLKLKDNLFIGQFTKNRDGSFTIRDIRRSDFSKVILQNGKEQQTIVYHPKITQPKDGKYYEFSWILNGTRKGEYVYLFKVDETKPLKEVDAFALIKKLKDDIMSYPAGAGQKIVKMLDTLKNQLTASGKEIFIYELLQNANDYPKIINGLKEPVDVEFHITRDSLLFLHSGAEFNEKNIAAICSINDKEKTDNKDTIGYKGIGFKTVFLDSNYVYLQTGNFSFRFDREETRDIVDTPWQILPIWTKYSELTASERYVFTNAQKSFRVKFALRPTNERTLRYSSHNYVKMFRDVFQNERVILFIPNLTSVKVFYNETSEPDIICYRDSSLWQIDDFEEGVPEEITTSINADIDDQEDSGSLKIPTKYYDFRKTKVSFACKIEGSILQEVDNTQLYCYLPTKASWGFRFLMNTDMIPTGPRDDIEIDFSEQININAEISEIAGRKFFDWIKSLCDLKKYKLNSVFKLIPTFETNVREHGKYKALIEKFKKGFDSQIISREFIPTNNFDYAFMKDVILDETGLMSSGIMADVDFLAITGYQGVLPIKELRNDREFKSFLRRYLKDLDLEDNIWDFDDLKSICTDSDFRGWVSEQENNNHFLDFLLKKDKLEDFLKEEIFLGVDGKLYNASNLYYDIDKYLFDLSSFSNDLYYLSPKTRDFFKDNKKWQDSISEAFNSFDCNEFVDDILLSERNRADIIQKLKDKNTSIHFFKFLAENVTFKESYKSLPFKSASDETVNDFDDKFVFFNSVVGKKAFESAWLSSVDVAFVSDDYTDETKKYFKENFGIADFSHDYLIDQIILSDDYSERVSQGIDDDYNVSKDFVDYCYKHKILFENGSLRNYALSVYNGNGENTFCLSEDVIYSPSAKYDDYAAKEWLGSDWMYVLNDDYYDEISDKKDFTDFLDKTFQVTKFTEKNFYQKVVKPNLAKIFQLTSGDKDSDGSKNIDFVSYLDHNYQLIFEEEHDSASYANFIVCSNNLGNLKISRTVYIYDDQLADILSQTWFPKGAAEICHKDYGNSMALKAIGCKSFEFANFYDAVIIPQLSSINKLVTSKELSITFHSYIIKRMRLLTSVQQAKMQAAKVYLYGHTNASATSTGHKTLSIKARELFDQKLVSISDLNIIDPDYKTAENVEYWETRLANSKFNVNDFFTWLKSNVVTFNKTIGTFEQSKLFYRWLKANANDQQLQGINQLSPGLVKFTKKTEGSRKSETIYFPDEYMTDGGIEEVVKLFDPNAWFISSDYIEDGDDIASWCVFWSKLDVKSEIVDILQSTVIPHLSTISNDKLPKLLADNRSALEKLYNNDLVSHLTGLRVKGHNGEYYTLNETIYIDCDLDEPFSYIELPNVIVFDSKEEKKLIKDIMEEVEGVRITKLSDWQQEKVDYYLELQDDDTESICEYHYRFVEELAVIRESTKERLKAIERIDEILLLGKDNLFHEAKDLTLGSVYRPKFDFESCGVVTPYVSDTYDKECKEKLGHLFKDMGIHSDFEEDDISVLTSRPCALYFWSQYLMKTNISIVNIKDIINKHLLDNLACIPTKDYMKRPTQLYFGNEVKSYVKSIYDWENKVPLQDIPEVKLTDGTNLLSLLPFGIKLKFSDALFALYKIPEQDRRTQLLQWMIADYDEDSHASIIEQYREDAGAKWYNNNNEPVQIKELYALDYRDKNLKQYLGTNRKIVNDLYFPAGDSFRKACDILGIPTITSADLIIECSDDTVITTEHTNFKVYALVIAGIIDSCNWKALYDAYCEKIDALILHKCSNINITCKQDKEISKSLKKFYHENDSTDFYYVDNRAGIRDGRIHTDFAKAFAKYIGALSITDDHLINLMYSPEDALQFIEENNTLKLDEDYKAELEKLISGATNNMSGKTAVVDNDEETDLYRPKISITREESPVDDEDEEEDIEKLSDDEELKSEKSDDEYTSDEEEGIEDVEEDVDNNNEEVEADEEKESASVDFELSEEEEYTLDDDLEATQQDDYSANLGEFLHATIQRYLDGEHEQVVCEHYRSGTWVRGHYRNGFWVRGHWRSGSDVSEHNPIAHDCDFTRSGSAFKADSASSGTTASEHKADSELEQSIQLPTAKESPVSKSKESSNYDYDPDPGLHIGSIDNDNDYQPFGSKPYSPGTRKYPKPFTKEEVDRLRSKGSPLVLESLPATKEEIDLLAQCGISPEQIADTNYLVQLRLYMNLRNERNEEPVESMEEFVRNADDVTTHALKGGRYIRSCSAARGVMYISPSVWKLMVDDKWAICVYLDGRGKNFHYINSADEFLKLVEKDDVVIKITGKEKVKVVNELYSSLLKKAKGTAYTLIRVAARTNMDAVFAHYIGAMAEIEDGNEDDNDY